jgi:HlyD family secretion protein
MEFLCAIPFLVPLFSMCLPPPPLAVGYIEGEFALIAPVEIAQVAKVLVTRGDRVAAGDVLAELENRDVEIALAQAEAELAAAESQLADLQHGKRQDEINMAEAALTSARAKLSEADRELERRKGLFQRSVISEAQLDVALTNREVAAANAAELEANLAVARLPARADQIKAAQARVAQQQAVLANAHWRLEQRTLFAPAPGAVFDIIRHRGEIAGPQSPVLSILPDGATKLRLYIPERALATISIGDVLRLNCDGCGPGLQAEVSYVSGRSEFTPPVIYSKESRQKLVFLIEARPLGEAVSLKPGQIVDVALDGPRE